MRVRVRVRARVNMNVNANSVSVSVRIRVRVRVRSTMIIRFMCVLLDQNMSDSPDRHMCSKHTNTDIVRNTQPYSRQTPAATGCGSGAAQTSPRRRCQKIYHHTIHVCMCICVCDVYLYARGVCLI